MFLKLPAIYVTSAQYKYATAGVGRGNVMQTSYFLICILRSLYTKFCSLSNIQRRTPLVPLNENIQKIYAELKRIYFMSTLAFFNVISNFNRNEYGRHSCLLCFKIFCRKTSISDI